MHSARLIACNGRCYPLSIIGNVCGWLCCTVYGDQLRKQDQLQTAIQESWKEVFFERLQSLLDSLPNVLFEVVN